MGDSKIEWTEKTWNPVTGCTKISPGCQNCYAERMSKRLAGRAGYPKDDPFRVTLHPDRMDEPLRWKKPSRIFVCSMSDLFHDDVPDDFIINLLSVMAEASQHTFLLLTKRPERMKEIINHSTIAADVWLRTTTGVSADPLIWPLPNVWLGVTAENQEQADKRIPVLLQIPAAVRFVSVEPMLGPVDLNERELLIDKRRFKYTIGNYLDWIICGGESGPGARPMHPDWARTLLDQCQPAGVPFFFKQWGEYCAPSQMPAETYQAWDQHHGTENCWTPDDPSRWRVGKKAAGRLLDGKEWNEYPE